MPKKVTCQRELDLPMVLSWPDTNGFRLPKCSRTGHTQSWGAQDGQKKISHFCPYTSARAFLSSLFVSCNCPKPSAALSDGIGKGALVLGLAGFPLAVGGGQGVEDRAR